MDYLDHHNAQPKPFFWTKSPGEILENVARANQVLKSQHQVPRSPPQLRSRPPSQGLSE